MKRRKLLPLVLGLALVVPGKSEAQGRKAPDRCIMNDDVGFVFVFQEVPTLSPGRTIPLRGLFFGAFDALGTVPIDGSAVLASDGSVRLGFVVHYRQNFIVKGFNVDTTLVGRLGFDWDGDYNSDYFLDFHPVDCTTLSIP